MDISNLWDGIPQPGQEIIIGMAGEVAASMVTAGGYQVKKRFAATPKQGALDRAVGHALAATALAISDDPMNIDHTLTLLGEWLADEAVVGELSSVIDPQPDVQLDIKALTLAFEDAGFDPETVGQGLGFAQVTALFTDAFNDAAAAEEELDGPIQIALLRDLAAQAKASSLTQAEQLAVQERIADAVEQLAASGGGRTEITNVAVNTQIEHPARRVILSANQENSQLAKEPVEGFGISGLSHFPDGRGHLTWPAPDTNPNRSGIGPVHNTDDGL